MSACRKSPRLCRPDLLFLPRSSQAAMYLPMHFKEERTPVLHEWIRNHPFATLVTLSVDGPHLVR
jgi:hypothetical protein